MSLIGFIQVLLVVGASYDRRLYILLEKERKKWIATGVVACTWEAIHRIK